MSGLEITKQLKFDIDFNQAELANAIRKHQKLLAGLKDDPYNVDLQKDINKAEQGIIIIGLEQKGLIDRLREEYKAYQKNVKENIIKNGIEEKRFNLTNALNRARKQNIVVRSTSANSISDESGEHQLSDNPSPERVFLNPVEPQDVSQSEFLNYFNLATHDVYREMQNKRAERKRRSTANPHFLYGNKEWGFFTQSKRKRNTFLLTPVSPPHTRQSVKKKQERVPSPTQGNKQEPSENDENRKVMMNSFPTIPNLPSGLIIERVSPGSSSPDDRTCVICKQSGGLTICDICNNGFHIGCHNRPLPQPPHECPKCINKETRTVGALNVPSGMSVSCVPVDLTDKINEKKELEEKKRTLSQELSELESRHSQLTISLNDQKIKQEELIMSQQSTEKKIQQILTFIENMRKPLETETVYS